MNFDLNLGSSLETPSFFETAAQERIVPTLLSAFEHSLTVMAARHPGLLLRVHNRRDEAFFLLLLLVERQCLATCDASLSETLFGLIRTATGGSEMPRRKARWSLCFLVLLPYIQRKLERIAAPSLDAVADDVVPCPPVLCNQGVGQVLCAKSKIRFLPERMKPRANALQARDEDGAQPDQAGNEGFRLPEEARGWAHLPSAPSIPSAPSGGGTLALPGAAGDWRAWVRRVYPWVHAAKEGSVLTFHILFLFQRSRFSSPWLRALWLELRRASPKDAARLAARVEAARAARAAWARRQPQPLRVLAQLLAGGWNAINDNFKMCILGLIVFVKLADWWFSSEGEAAPEALPGIPPPSRPPSPEDGIPAPSARDECAICGRKRTNPTAATSGYVFCYPCIFRHVQEKGTCPVSLMPCGKDDLRRLYESA